MSTINTWKHINERVLTAGLTSLQIFVGLFIPLAVYRLSIVATIIITIIEVLVLRWYQLIQKKIDEKPFEAMQVKNSSPELIQDNDDFFEQLLS